MDALSEILKAVKLQGSLFFNAELSAPWCLREPAAEEIAPYLSPEGGSVVLFHMVIDGVVHARLPRGESAELTPGDVIVFPHGDHHILGSGKQMKPVDSMKAFAGNLKEGLKLARYGGGGELSRLVCGYISCDSKLHDLFLWGLPRMFTVRLIDGPGGEWLQNAIRYSVSDGATGAGSQLVIAKLTEVLFVETIRQYLNGLPEDQTGWLAGIRDPAIGLSIACMHTEPAEPWTVDSLAHRVGLSRTAFAERFQRYLGVAPMTYLGKWRLRLGADLLATGTQGVFEIALLVGYASEASFNRAFKREFGLPPAQYRRKNRTETRVSRVVVPG